MVLNGESNSGVENSVVAKFGRRRYILWTFRAVKISGDSLIGIIAIGQEITERLCGEKELLRTREELMIQTLYSQRLSALATMAGGIAHELNQPLSGIRVYSDTIYNLICGGREFKMEKIIETVTKINGQVDRASKVINHMREFASDQKNVAEVYVNVRDLVEDVVELLGEQLRNHGILLLNNVNREHRIQVNKTHIEHVLVHLITNARDSIQAKQYAADEKRQIWITSAKRRNRIIVRIGDTGSLVS